MKVRRSPADYGSAPAEPPLRSPEFQQAAQLPVVAGPVHFDRPPGKTAASFRQRFRDDVHHAAQCIGPVQEAGRPAHHFDSVRQPGVDRGAILVAPGVVLQPEPPFGDQDPAPREASNNRFAHLHPCAQGAHPGHPLQHVGYRHALVPPQALVAQRRHRQNGRYRCHRFGSTGHHYRLQFEASREKLHHHLGRAPDFHHLGGRQVARTPEHHRVPSGRDFAKQEGSVIRSPDAAAELRDEHLHAGDATSGGSHDSALQGIGQVGTARRPAAGVLGYECTSAENTGDTRRNLAQHSIPPVRTVQRNCPTAARLANKTLPSGYTLSSLGVVQSASFLRPRRGVIMHRCRRGVRVAEGAGLENR